LRVEFSLLISRHSENLCQIECSLLQVRAFRRRPGLRTGFQNRPTIKQEKNNKPAFAADCRTLAGIPPALILLVPTLLGRQEIEALLIDMLG